MKFTNWQAGASYNKGDFLQLGGMLFKVKRKINYAERMPGTYHALAYYRPLTPFINGTLKAPVPYVQGINCYQGLVYSYEGGKYLRRSDKQACYTEPNVDSPSWELLTDEQG